MTLISRLSAVLFLLFVFGGAALAEDKLRPLPEFEPMAFSIVRSIAPGC